MLLRKSPRGKQREEMRPLHSHIFFHQGRWTRNRKKRNPKINKEKMERKSKVKKRRVGNQKDLGKDNKNKENVLRSSYMLIF